MALLCLLALSAQAAAQPGPGISVRAEPWGTDAIRVRLTPKMEGVLERPSALLPYPLPTHLGGSGAGGAGPEDAATLTNGNIRMSMGPGGQRTFTRVSDGKELLVEASVTFGRPDW